jgi:hypothetical protein
MDYSLHRALVMFGVGLALVGIVRLLQWLRDKH